MRVAALAVTFLWTPGHIATGLLRPDFERGERLLGALALSPALAGGLAATLLAAGATPLAALRWVAGAILVASLFLARAPGPEPAAERSMPLLPAILWAAVVLAFLAWNPFLAPRSDGWFHAAVAQQIAGRGLPVEDPSFAGLRLLYFWGMHAWAALWLVASPATGPWVPWIALNAAGALAVMLAVASLAKRLGASPAAQRWTAAATLFGAAPFAWAWVAVRAAAGNERGLCELARLVLSGADPALRALGPGLLHPSLASFADKYLVLTPFGLGLALFALFVAALHDAALLDRPARLAWLGLVTAAALFTHTVAGFSAIAVAWAWWALHAGAASRRAFPWRTLAGVAGAVAAGVMIALPYLAAVTRGKQGAIAPGFSLLAVTSLLQGGALLLPAAALGFAREDAAAGPAERRAARTLLLAVLVVGAMGLLVRLPENNQSKFFNLLFLLLAVPAGIGVADVAGRLAPRMRALYGFALAALALPTAALVAVGFAAERGQSPDSWHEPAPAVRAAWAWLREHTPPDAVVADEGGAREPMVFAARSALAPGGSLERNWGPPAIALAARRLASRELAARGPVSASTDSLLRALAPRLVIVAERKPGVARDTRPSRAGALEDSLAAAGPRRPRAYYAVHDAGPLVFWRVEEVR